MSDRLLIGTRKGLFVFERRSSGWSIAERAFLGDHVNMVAHDPRDDTCYATLHHGHFGTKLHRSDDQAANWHEVSVPVYPEPPEGHAEPPNPMTGVVVKWSLDKVWSLVPGFQDSPGELWCGTIPGGLFRSRDRGDSWELIRSLWDEPPRQQWMGGGEDFPGIHSILLDDRNGRRITVGISIGGVWHSDDDGQTWKITGRGITAEYMPPEQQDDPHVQDVHMLAQAPSNPDVIWTQHHNGVFVTRDAGASWQQIEGIAPSHFGFAVAVHPHDSQVAWLVPAIKDEHRIPVDGQLVVTRTRDGGATWEQLRNGLPQQDAYDLTFRHALDVDTSGDRVAFGSTTGSLWLSEDQGDSWQALSVHLPPVYCVRFVTS